MIRVQAPNGSIVEFPPNTPMPVIEQAMRDAFGGGQQQAQPDPIRQRAEAMADQYEKVRGKTGAGDLLKNSFTLGLGDKMTGVMQGVGDLLTGGSFGEGYKVGSMSEQILEERARQRSGNLGTAAEIGGSLLTGSLLRAPAAATAFGRIGQSAKEAATLGAVQGAGDSEATNVGGLLGDAAMGGALGGALGGGLTGTLEAAKPLVRGGRAMLGAIQNVGRNPQQKAAERVVQVLSDDGLTVNKALNRMERGGISLLDAADENAMGLTRAAAARPGPGRTTITKALDKQQAESAGKLTGMVNSALGGGDETFNTRLARMIMERGQSAKPAYQKAFDQNFGLRHSTKFDDLAKRIPAEAVTNAKKIAQAEGRPFGQQLVASIDEVNGVKFSRTPSLREWHYIQRGLRTAKDKAYRDGVGEVGTAYKNLHREILDTMDEANPYYKAARQMYASESELVDALKMGRDIMKKSNLDNVDELATTFAQLSKPEKEMVRAGLSRGLEDLIASTPSEAGDVAKKIFGTPQKRAAIKAVFGNDTEFRKFQQRVMLMSKQGKNFRAIRGNSRTSFVDAEKDAFGAMNDLAGGLVDVARGGYVNATMRGLSKLLGNLGGMDDQVAAQVAKIMVSQDPNFVTQALSKAKTRAAKRQINNELMRRVENILRAGAVSTGAGLGASVAQAQ